MTARQKRQWLVWSLLMSEHAQRCFCVPPMGGGCYFVRWYSQGWTPFAGERDLVKGVRL